MSNDGNMNVTPMETEDGIIRLVVSVCIINVPYEFIDLNV